MIRPNDFKVLEMKLKMFLIPILFIMLTACSPGPVTQPGHETDTPVQVSTPVLGQNISRELEAQSAVMDYYAALNQGSYDQAVELYGGSYEELQYFNPDFDPDDRAGLLQAGCTFNGLMCLQVLDLPLIQPDEPDEFVYEVSFANPDGSLFVLGPCCGATEEEMPPVSLFTVHVTCEDEGRCLVLQLPPYVP
jgi:hypothetical protein